MLRVIFLLTEMGRSVEIVSSGFSFMNTLVFGIFVGVFVFRYEVIFLVSV